MLHALISPTNGVLKVLVEFLYLPSQVSSESSVLFVERLPPTAIEGKKGNGLESKRLSGSITRCTVSFETGLLSSHAQAAKNDGPTEASDSPDQTTIVSTNEGDYRARLTV